MTQTIEDRECTENCKSTQHGDLICASLTKGCVSEADVWCFSNVVCCCCETVKDSSGRTALHAAASCGKTDIVKWLCERKHCNINARDAESGYTALHRSVFYGKIDCAVCLMKQGANVTLQDSDGLTILEHAMYDQKARECSEDGEIYVWGSNTNNTLGPQQARSVPEIMDIFHKENPQVLIKQVCLSRFHCVIVSTDGRVFSCGHGQGGRLGLSTEHSVLVPNAVKFNINSQTSSVVCVKASIAQDHSVFLTDTGHIWTCGLNTHRVLGFSPPPEKLLAPRPLQHFSNPVTGVIAMKYHTVAWSSKAIYTWGLHAGQLGHDKSGKTYIMTPKQIPSFHSVGSTISLVAGSIGATAFLTSVGDIYVLHEYRCRKIAGKQLDVIQLSIIGGKLDTTVESCVSSDHHPLKICILNNAGRVLMWQENDQQLLRCIFSINRSILVKQISLNINHLLIVTKDGEAFEGIVKERRKRNSDSGMNAAKSAFHKFLDKDDCRLVKVVKIPRIHRAVFIESDLDGKNFAVIQINPRTFLTKIPDISPSTIQQDMYKFLQNSDEYDEVHDVIFQTNTKKFPAHKFICCARKMELPDLQIDSSADEVKVDFYPEIFNQLLFYVYTGTCNLLLCQKCPTELENLKEKNTKSSSTDSKPSKKDPVRLLQDCAKQMGVRTLQKILEDYHCHNGYIKCKSDKKYISCMVKFDRNSCLELYDVIIKTKNDKELKAHKCILVARSEYFSNLFSLRWTESSTAYRISLPFSHSVVEHFLEFLYTDELSSIENEDIENVCSLLILADEYFVERLKQICEYVLSAHVTLKNVSQMFAFSHTYNAKQLSQCCMDFICLNLSAVLESRCLEDIDEGLLKDLTDFYCKWNPIFQQRYITPYSTAPDDEVVLEIAEKYPFPPNVEDGEAKPHKTVARKRTKSHKNKFATVVGDADKENAVKEEGLSSVFVRCEGKTEEKLRESPSAPARIEAIHSALKQIEMEAVITDFTALPRVDLKSLGSFPELGSPPTATNGGFSKVSKSCEKVEAKTKIVKLSQKQRKRLSSESCSSPTQPETPKNPWKLCGEKVSPETAVVETKISAIIDAEKKQKENLTKMRSKSLIYTQKEDKAIEDLYKFYNVDNVFDEIITIDRVRMHLIGSPVWVHKQKS